MASRTGSRRIRLSSVHTVLTIIVTLGYLLATHLSTISSLKAAIADKADREELERIDKKLTRIEVKLEQAIISKREFEELRQYLDKTLLNFVMRPESKSKGEVNERNGFKHTDAKN